MNVLSSVALGMLMALQLPAAGALAHGGEASQGGVASRQSVVPSSPSEGLIKTWSALLAARDEIAMDIEAGTSHHIREQAVAVPELAEAVMRQSGNLSEANRARVRSGVTQLTKVAEHLRIVAGKGDAKILLGDLKRIDRALRLIRAQYPGDSLPLGIQSAAGHATGHH